MEVVQQCSVYTGLMDYIGILQGDFHKGHVTDFFYFPKFPSSFYKLGSYVFSGFVSFYG